MAIMKSTESVSKIKCLEESKEVDSPDGGWGFMVCVGFVFVFVPCFAYKSCFGMIFNGFLQDLGEGIGKFSMVSGLLSTALNVSGLLSSILLKTFSLRKVGWFGGFLYISGMLGNCFVTSVNQMLITVGLLQGTGCGIMIAIGFTSFNQYFSKRRLMVMSITKIFFSLGIMAYPMFIKFLMQEYGLRGTNLIATAIDLHVFLGIALMQPIKWHQKRRKNFLIAVEENSMKYDIDNENKEKNQKIFVPEESKTLLPTNNTLCEGKNLQKREQNENLIEDEKEHGYEYDYSLVNSDTKSIQKLPLNNVSEKEKSKWDIVVKYLDLDLLKDRVFINIAFGMSFGMTAEAIFYMLLPLYLYSINFTIGDVALCLSAISAGDLISRVTISIVSSIFDFKSRSLFFFGVVGTGIIKLIFLQMSSFTGILVICGISGFFSGCIHVPISLIYAEYSTEKFTAAYGLGFILSAMCSAVITPIFGILKDFTESFTAAFYLNAAITLLCMIPWALEFWFVWNNKRKIKANT